MKVTNTLLYVPGVSHGASSAWRAFPLFSPLGEKPDKIKHSQKAIDYPYFLPIHHCMLTALTKKLITFFLLYLFRNCKRTEMVPYLCPCPRATGVALRMHTAWALRAE